MADYFKNFAFGQITVFLDDSSTTVWLDDITTFPSAGQLASSDFWAVIESPLSHPDTFEIVKVTDVNTLHKYLTIVRGQEGTVASPHAEGTFVKGTLTAGHLQRLAAAGAGNALIFKGDATVDTLYEANDVVRYQGHAYVCLTVVRFDGSLSAFQRLEDAIVGLPSGGLAGQALVKASDSDADVEWADPATPAGLLPAGGSTGQVLAKTSSSDFAASWTTPSTSGGGGGTDSTAMHYRGDWSSTGSYAVGDVVTYNGSDYVCTTPITAGVAAPTFVGSAGAGEDGAHLATLLPFPAGTAAGDLAIVGVGQQGGRSAAVPTGFATLATVDNHASGGGTYGMFGSLSWKVITSDDITNGGITGLPAEGSASHNYALAVVRGGDLDTFATTIDSLTTSAVTSSTSALVIDFAAVNAYTPPPTLGCSTLTGVVSYGNDNYGAIAVGYEPTVDNAAPARTFTVVSGETYLGGGPVTMSAVIKGVATGSSFPAGSFATLGATSSSGGEDTSAMHYRGDWVPTSYVLNDVVVHDGVTYVCTTASEGPASTTYIGGASAVIGDSGTDIPLPAGTNAGDLILITQGAYGSQPTLPTGATPSTVQNSSSMYLVTSTLIAAANQTVVTVPHSGTGQVGVVEVFRAGSIVAAYQGGTLTTSTFTVPAASLVSCAAATLIANGSTFTMTAPSLTDIQGRYNPGGAMTFAGYTSSSYAPFTWTTSGEYLGGGTVYETHVETVISPTSSFPSENFRALSVADEGGSGGGSSSGSSDPLASYTTPIVRVRYYNFTANQSGGYGYFTLGSTGSPRAVTIQAGWTFSYDVYYQSIDTHTSLDICDPSHPGSYMRDNSAFHDQNSIGSHPNNFYPSAIGAWVTRTFSLTPFAGGAVPVYASLGMETGLVGGTEAVTYFRNVCIKDASGRLVASLLMERDAWGYVGQVSVSGGVLLDYTSLVATASS
jgi:hypothetical protein